MSSTRFDITETPLAGLKVVQRKPLADVRGFFARFYCAEELLSAGFKKPIAQMNHTLTRSVGAVRGLHFQYPPHAETKLVSCLSGEIFDVAVDIRRGSPTFLKWYGDILSAENQKSLLIPEGFAHGFQAMTEDCELLYLHTAGYSSDAEGALHHADPQIGISWPLSVTDLSTRDQSHPYINESFLGIEL
jgi:dTDP-4-dehydrorhamnose 3,5-epimerase